MSWLQSLGELEELVTAIEMDLLDIREPVDMHQFCAYWGAYDVFSYIKDCICLVHGAIGCMANRRFLPTMGASEPCEFDPQYSTAFTEHDVIFGGERKLRTALKEIDAKHAPKLIAVITNCCADIIGDDVAGVVRSVSEVDKKTVWLHTGGFTGKSYRAGSEQAMAVLARIMEEAPPRPIRKGTINVFLRRWIWGENEASEIAESIRIMEKMGLTVNKVMRKGISLDDFIAFKEAEANVAACFFFGMALFEEMNLRFGTKTIKASAPVGLTQTLAWMDDIRRTMNLDHDPRDDDEVRELEAMRAAIRAKIGTGRKAVIWTQTGERMIGMTRLAMDLGLDPVVVGVDPATVRDKIRMFRKEVDDGFNPKISTAQTVEDIRALAKELGDPVIFCADDYFPDHPVFRYRAGQQPVYGLAGCRLLYGHMMEALTASRSRYSLTAQVIPA